MDSKKFIEIRKPVEEVREIEGEYKIPSYKEFMKTYKSDESLNYADLEHSDLGDKKGYGPCDSSSCPYPSSTRFYVEIGFSSESFYIGGSREKNFRWKILRNIQQARDFLDGFEKREYRVWEKDTFYDNRYSRNYSKEDKIKNWLHNRIKEHEAGKEVYETDGDFCCSIM